MKLDLYVILCHNVKVTVCLSWAFCMTIGFHYYNFKQNCNDYRNVMENLKNNNNQARWVLCFHAKNPEYQSPELVYSEQLNSQIILVSIISA